MRLLTYSFVALVDPVGGSHPRARGRGACPVGRGVGDLRRLRSSPEPTASRGGIVAGGARRASRVAAPGIRHPLPGLSICVRRSVPETSHGACSRSSRSRSRRSRRSASDLPPSRNSSRPIPRQMTVLVTLWVATALLYPSCVAPPHGSSTRSSCIGRITDRCEPTIARASQNCDDVPTLLSMVCEQLAPALNAAFVTWREWTSSPGWRARRRRDRRNESAAFVDRLPAIRCRSHLPRGSRSRRPISRVSPSPSAS